MGAMLPKPVESAVIERQCAKAFRVATAEVNGWRNNMEDSHLVHMCDDWGFFGVFDGHGGDQCSAFVAERISQQLCLKGCPKNDAELKHLCLDVDKQFLDTGQDSGSTGTMVIVQRPTNGSSKFRLRLANVGDSRVLLGRRDGTIVDCAHPSGTDQGLTTDHKPDHPSEKERIYRCGGHVAQGQMGGPARVNGELSVSRCFGDASHKKTGGPGPEDHPVTADPELGTAECNESDFLLLVCDGISEGDFPNAAVVKMVANHLKQNDDAGLAAQAICHKAIEQGSKDNVTCMVVLLVGSGKDKLEKSKEFIPGQLSAESLTNKAFMDAYEGMAKRAGKSLAEAAEMRYDMVSDSLSRNGLGMLKAKEMRAETEAIGTPVGPSGSSKRSAWFRNWEEKLPENMTVDEEEQMMRMMLARQGGLAGLQAGGFGGPRPPGGSPSDRRVRVADLSTLRRAVNENPALEWDPRLSQLAGVDAMVTEDDPSDGTSQVSCASASMTAWLPTSALTDVDDSSAAAKGQSRGGAGRGGQLPPRLDARPGSLTDTLAAAGARRGAAAKSQPLGGARGTSPSTPTNPQGGPRGASPSQSSLSQSGARFFAAPRLPNMAATGPSLGGNRTSSPLNRAPSPGSGAVAAGMRAGAGRYRAPSPIDFAQGNRPRNEVVPAGRQLSRSVPPRPPHATGGHF